MGCASINDKLKRSKYKNNLNNSNSNLQNVTSAYILSKIFDNISTYKRLGIIRYNKKFQKKLNLSINNYKEYSALYSSIEIEIKIANDEYGKLINISDSEREYYHIYFDDKKEEIKSNTLYGNDNLNKIKIKIDYQVKSFKKLFYNCSCVESIYFKQFYRNNIFDMSYMFYGCSKLKKLKFSNSSSINTNNMSYMFSRCSLLEELNLSNFITNNVTNMSWMFYQCSSLKELNLSNFNTIYVTNMTSMFDGCSSLKELNISNFNTINVTDMTCMFDGCSSLIELNISNFNTNNVTKMTWMFCGCSNEFKKKINQQNKRLKL